MNVCIGLFLIFCSVFIFTKILDVTIDLEEKWKTVLKVRFDKWLLLKKQGALLHRINLNRFKLKRLSVVEEVDTPEMLALSSRLEADVELFKTLGGPAKSEMDLAEPVVEDDITLSTLIFDKIDEMIILETQAVLFPLAYTGDAIDVRNYGNYMQTVAKAVQNGLNLGVYKSTTVFKPEYINSYIVKKSSIMILTTMMELNKQLPPSV